MVEESVVRTVRRQARDELTRRIVETARAQLGAVGASGLSLRAVARELGMVSSAVYRYVPSRDELLTLLIIEAYEALGAAAERAESRVAREDVVGRFRAVCHGVRRWAIRNPHEYALIYGSPVPGYAAPETTIGPASRVGALLAGILVDRVAADGERADGVAADRSAAQGARAHRERSDGVRAGERPAVRAGTGHGEDGSALPEPVRRSIAPVRSFFPPQVPDELVVTGLMAWTYLFGAVSFELFGHRHNVVADPASLREAFFEHEISRIAVLTGITD